ncbi:MAG: hypothetical protein ACLP7Q_20430 [Isosphaeraceae bacterium]
MTKKPTIDQVENAFQPAREITDADRFAGRKVAISDAYHALLSKGSNLAIVGNRGIGKTSLARQVINIGTGKTSLLDKLALKHDCALDFLAVYFACGTSVKSTDQLLESVLT